MGNCCRRSVGQDKRGQVYLHSYTNGIDVLETEFPESSLRTQLLSSIADELKQDSVIHTINISIPVCTTGQESPVTFTNIDVIHTSIARLYPEIVIFGNITDADLPDKLNSTGITANYLLHRKPSIKTCIDEMKKNPKNYHKQLSCAQIIGTLVDDESMKFLLIKPDAISCLLTALKTFPHETDLQLNIFTSLLNIASISEANCIHIATHNGVHIIKNTLCNHMVSPSVVKLVMKTIKYISSSVNLAQTLAASEIYSEILQVLSKHPSEREIVSDGYFILGNLLVSEKIAINMMSLGVVSSIVSLFEKFPDDASVLENACRTLGCFAVFDELHLEFSKSGATLAVVTLLKVKTFSVFLSESCLWSLACLTTTEYTCKDVILQNGVETIMKIISEHFDSESIQEYGIRILYNLSSFESTVKYVSTSAVASHLMKVFQFFPVNLELTEVIIVTSSHIISGNGSMLKTLAENHYINSVLKVMATYSENILIQEHGCKIICSMSAQDDIRNLVEDDGASKAVIAAMLMFDKSCDIQEVGCLSLINLTAKSRVNKIRAMNSGAVPTLLHTINEFVKDSSSVLLALRALSNLVSVEEACHQILDNKGLEILAWTIDNFHHNTEVLAETAQVLSGISHLSELKQADLEDINQKLMTMWSLVQNDAQATLNICQAWENFLKTDEGRQLHTRNIILENILQAMERFAQDELLQYTCCRIIALKSLYGHSQEFSMAEKALRSVLICMERFPLEAEMQIVGCGTLSCIVKKLENLKEKCISLGGVSSIARALKSNVNDFRIAYVSVLALGHLMPIDAKKHPNDNALAVSTILTCMKNFLTNKDILIVGSEILSKSVLTETLSTEFNKVIETAKRHHRCNFHLD